MVTLVELLAFLLPFERLPSWELIGLTIRLGPLVLLVLLVVAVPMLLGRKMLRPLGGLDWAVLGLWLMYLLSAVYALNQARALIVAAIFGLILVSYLVVSRLARDSDIRARVIRAVLIGAYATAGFGLFQFFGDALGLSTTITGLLPRYTDEVFGFTRIQSVGVEPLYYANFLLLPIFILIALILKGQGTKSLRAGLVLLLWVFTLTLSRGAFLGFGVGILALVVVATIRSQPPYYWRSLVTSLLVALILSAGSILAVAGLRGLATFGNQTSITESPTPGSTTSRLEHYRNAWWIFQEHPLLGVGAGNYDAASRLPDTSLDQGRQIVNNQYLETLAETGLVGLLLLAMVLLAALHRLWHYVHSSVLALGLLGALVAIIVQYNFFSTIYILHIWFTIGLIGSLSEHEPIPNAKP